MTTRETGGESKDKEQMDALSKKRRRRRYEIKEWGVFLGGGGKKKKKPTIGPSAPA